MCIFVRRTNPGHLSVLSFVAPWSENCIATKELTRELVTDPELKVIYIDWLLNVNSVDYVTIF